MIPLEDCVAVLLCAGLSRRFGPGNKLLALLDGRPLASYPATLCVSIPLAGRIAVVPAEDAALDALLTASGFTLVVNPRPEAGKDSSLRLGLAAALACGARGALVLLGDMPHIDATHLQALSAAANDEQAAISHANGTVSPPTLFPASIAQRALDRPDRAVRDSLGNAIRVAAPDKMLADYDTAEQFAAR